MYFINQLFGHSTVHLLQLKKKGVLRKLRIYCRLWDIVLNEEDYLNFSAHSVYPLQSYPVYPKSEQVETAKYPPNCQCLPEHSLVPQKLENSRRPGKAWAGFRDQLRLERTSEFVSSAGKPWTNNCSLAKGEIIFKKHGDAV